MGREQQHVAVLEAVAPGQFAAQLPLERTADVEEIEADQQAFALVAREQQRVDFERVRATVGDAGSAVTGNRNWKCPGLDYAPSGGGSYGAMRKFKLSQLCSSPAPVEAAILEGRVLCRHPAGMRRAVCRRIEARMSSHVR
jgi:hypothetical protein